QPRTMRSTVKGSPFSLSDSWIDFTFISPQSFSQSAQVSKAINSRAVSVGPARLQRVTAHEVEPDKLKTLVSISYMRPRDITEYSGFAPARCTGTRAS